MAAGLKLRPPAALIWPLAVLASALASTFANAAGLVLSRHAALGAFETFWPEIAAAVAALAIWAVKPPRRRRGAVGQALLVALAVALIGSLVSLARYILIKPDFAAPSNIAPALMFFSLVALRYLLLSSVGALVLQGVALARTPGPKSA